VEEESSAQRQFTWRSGQGTIMALSYTAKVRGFVLTTEFLNQSRNLNLVFSYCVSV
jgi:hypothetical protein